MVQPHEPYGGSQNWQTSGSQNWQAGGQPVHGPYAGPSHAAPQYAPTGGPQAYSAPQSYGAPHARPASAGTNGLAVASLVLSLMGFLGGFVFVLVSILSLAGVICGHVALAQIKRTSAGGKEMAIAGLIIGYISLVLSLAIFLILLLFVGSLAGLAGIMSGLAS